MKIKNRSRKRSHKRGGIGVRRIRTFPTPLTTPSLTFRSWSSENQIVGVGSRSGRINQSQCTFPRFVIGLVWQRVSCVFFFFERCSDEGSSQYFSLFINFYVHWRSKEVGSFTIKQGRILRFYVTSNQWTHAQIRLQPFCEVYIKIITFFLKSSGIFKELFCSNSCIRESTRA